MGTSFLLRLFFAQARLHPARLALASLAVISSACAVAWVVSGYDALVSQFDENAAKYLGRYDAIVLPAGRGFGPAPNIPRELIEDLKSDPAVLEVNPLAQSRASITAVAKSDVDEQNLLNALVGSKPPVNGAPPMDPVLVATDASEGPYEMVAGEWLSAGEAANESVLSQGAATWLRVDVGDEIDVTTVANRVRLRVVGIIERAPAAMAGRGAAPSRSSDRGSGGPAGSKAPDRMGSGGPPGADGTERGGSSSGGPGQAGPGRRVGEPARSGGISIPTAMSGMPPTHAVYVRFATAEQANGFKTEPAIVQVALREGFDVAAFHRVWDERLASGAPPFRVVDFESVREGFATSGSVSQSLAQSYSATALAAMAAVFIIFSTLSMGVSERARELAMLRAIALTRNQVAGLIAIESLALALVGWLGGLAAGWLILSLASGAKPDLFPNGVKLGWTCVWLTGASVLAGALGAAVLPAWRAMRIRPVDAMAPPESQASIRWPIVCFLIGLALISLAPLSVFFLSLGDSSRVLLYAIVSYPALMIGMALITPAAILACERILTPALARLMRIDGLLLREHLSGNLWRTVGTVLALASGLALFASTQTWGYSMLQPFLPGAWLPDALVGFQPVGVTDEDATFIAQVPGVVADKVLPLAVEQSPVAWPDGKISQGMGMDNVTVIGLNASVALAEDGLLEELAFVEGHRTDAIKSLASESACLISEDYAMRTRLSVGDTLTMLPPNAPRESVEYRIAGVVSLPGWQWFTKFSGVRKHFVRTGGIVLADRARVGRDFQLGDRQEFFWLALDSSIPLAEIEAGLQKLAERHAGEQFATSNVGPATAYRPFARLTATETIRRGVSLRADGMIWGMSKLPLVTLAITSLGVINTIAASVRARTWEFAILRAIGTTRGEVVRVILAEAVLIGIVTCLVSVAFGLIAGWCGVGMSRYSGGFFGGPPVLVIPTRQLVVGFAATLILCLAAACWPALRTARREPLALLQAGRAAL